jgi:hypothetical protein
VLTADGFATLNAAAPRYMAWVRQRLFADLDHGQEAKLADIVCAVDEMIPRNGTLPRPEVPF